MKGYYTQHVAFVRVRDIERVRDIDQVVPMRIRKEWVTLPDGRTVYAVTDAQPVAWHELACRARDVPNWNSDRLKPESREQLIADSVILPAGEGQPYLPM